MHPQIMGQRNAQAQAKMVEAITTLGGRFDLQDLAQAVVDVHSPDPRVRDLMQRERMVEMLEALEERTRPAKKAKTRPEPKIEKSKPEQQAKETPVKPDEEPEPPEKEKGRGRKAD